jgi:hypothetical protein
MAWHLLIDRWKRREGYKTFSKIRVLVVVVVVVVSPVVMK